VQVFVVWQPMLATDVAPPVTAVLRRVGDGRARQYWDPNHLLAKQLAADARQPQPEPECCERSGILWDLAAVYPVGSRWEERLPPATFFNGPVADVADAIGAAVLRPPRPTASAGRTMSTSPEPHWPLASKGAVR
jgi:hypothetical protein